MLVQARGKLHGASTRQQREAMKTKHALIGIVLLAVISALGCATRVYAPLPAAHAPTPRLSPGASEAADIFFEDLSSYGSWVWLEGPGWVWSPHNVSVDWRPYVLGHWAYTDYGWTWVSEETWGWAAYHYGRWSYESSYGWVWMPGKVWAPAWVSWQYGNGWVGWAPLSWRVKWRVDSGLDWGRIDRRDELKSFRWCFVKTSDLVEPNLKHHIAPAARNVTLINITNNVTHYTTVENRIINGGVKVGVVQKVVGRPIPRLRVREADSPEVAHGGKVRGRDLVVLRRGVPRTAPSREPDRASAQRERRKTRPARSSSKTRAGASPAAAPRSVSSGKVRRNEEEKRRLESRHVREKDRLERIHAWESQNPPDGLSKKKVDRRQSEEHRALGEKQKREQRLLQQRQKRQRDQRQPAQAAAKPGSTTQKSKDSEPAKSKSGERKKEKSKSGKSKSGKSKPKQSESEDSEHETDESDSSRSDDSDEDGR
jgi:hypothetical protein